MKKFIKENSFWLLAYLFLTIAYFYPILSLTVFKNPGNNIIQGDDLLGVSVYDRLLLIKSFKEFVIPWWNPYIHNGFTFHSIACGQFFYPFTLLHLIMPVLSAFTVNYMVHVFLAGAGMFFFLKSLRLPSVSAFISGIIFMFCSFTPSNIYNGHFAQLDTFIWLPWYFYAFEKAISSQGKNVYKYTILGAMFVTLSLLAGHWQFVVMGLAALLFYAIFVGIWNWFDGEGFNDCIKPIGILLAFVIGGTLLAAAQVIPTLIDMNYTIRSAGEATYDVVAGYPFRIMDIITFLAPFFENRVHWEDAGYMGVLPLFLAFYALVINVAPKQRRKIVFFLCLAIFALLLSFGNQSPFYAIHYFLKPLRTFRVPARFIAFWMFGLSILSAYGFDGLIKLNTKENRKKALVYSSCLGALFILLILSAQVYSPKDSKIAYTKYLPLLFIILSLLSVIMYALFHKCYKVLIIFSILLITTDLFLYKKTPLPSSFSYLGYFDMTERLNNEAWWLKPIRGILDKEKDAYSYSRVNWSEQPILNMTYYPLTIKGTFLYDGPWNCPLTRVYNVQELAVNSGGVNSPLYDLFGVRYVWSKEELDKGSGSKYRKETENIFLNTKALPRAFIVYKYKRLDDRDAIFQEMLKPDFNPAEVALVSKRDIPLELYAGESKQNNSKSKENAGKADIIEYGFNNVSLKVITNNSGILVLSDAYHPGWRAYIDGKVAKIFPVDWAVRGVYVLPGEHIVRFYFFPWYYKLGICISLLTLAIFIILLKK